MYNPKSLKAEEFISHEEILDTLKYADENKDNMTLINEILEKAESLRLSFSLYKLPTIVEIFGLNKPLPIIRAPNPTIINGCAKATFSK